MSNTYPPTNTSVFRGYIGIRDNYDLDLSPLAVGGTYVLSVEEAKYGNFHVFGSVTSEVTVQFQPIPGMHWVIWNDVTHADTFVDIQAAVGGVFLSIPDATIVHFFVDSAGHPRAISATSTPVQTLHGGDVITSGTSTPRRRILMTLCAGFTPTGTGGDSVELMLPQDAYANGSTLLWDLQDVLWRTGTAYSGTAPVMKLECCRTSGPFTAHVASATISATAFLGANEVDTLTPIPGGDGQHGTSFIGGDRFRFNVTTVGDAAGWTIVLEFREHLS